MPQLPKKLEPMIAKDLVGLAQRPEGGGQGGGEELDSATPLQQKSDATLVDDVLVGSQVNGFTDIQSRARNNMLPFLTSLLGCSRQEAEEIPLTWQTFPDTKNGNHQLTLIRHGSLKKYGKRLDNINQQGGGVFVTVNETDLKGRSKNSIMKVRALWADLDEKDAKAHFNLDDLPIRPTIVVKSGHGTHLYWVLTEPIEATQEVKDRIEALLKDIQRTLAEFGADKKVCEVSRVMRFPGFFNRKAEPFPLVSILPANGLRYTEDEIREAFSMGGKEAGALPRRMETKETTGSEISPQWYLAEPDKIRLATHYLKTCPPAISGKGGHPATFKAAMMAGPGHELDEATTLTLLREVYNPRCEPPWPEKDLAHKVHDAFKNAKDKPCGWMLRKSGDQVLNAKSVQSHEAMDTCQGGLDPTLPCFENFHLKCDGLWKQEWNRTTKTEEPVMVAGPFRVLQEVRDSKSGKWGLRLVWRDDDGVEHTGIIPRQSIIGEAHEAVRMLVSDGLKVLHSRDLICYLRRVSVHSRARTADKIGWHGPVFVLPDETIGSSEEEVFLDPPLADHSFQQQGTLLEWEREIGRYALGNSRLMFAISVAFSAALSGILKGEGAGYHLVGASSKGKSVSALVGGSAWGGPKYKETWRATSNGLESVAVAHNDALLVLDEQGQADPTECAEVVYLLGNGIDKIRSQETLTLRARRRWLVTIISTGECTLNDKLAELGKKSKAGQDVRLIDIPACPQGYDQAFETDHGLGSTSALATHLTSAAQRFYGTPSRAFLKRMTLLPQEVLVKRVQDETKKWIKLHVPAGADSQVHRVAEKFALTAVAGELANAWTIVPWRPQEANWAAVTCFNDWLANRGSIKSGELHQGVKAVLDFIDRHGQSRFTEISKDTPRSRAMTTQAAGYKNTSNPADVLFLFTPSGWQEACQGFNPREIAQEMIRLGLLLPSQDREKKAQRNVRIGQGTKRLYMVSDAAVSKFREQEHQNQVLLPRGNTVDDLIAMRNSVPFFDSAWMFPSSLDNSQRGQVCGVEEAAVLMGASLVRPWEETPDMDIYPENRGNRGNSHVSWGGCCSNPVPSDL